jgi:type IV secretory pathway VirB2 component (pilin)
MDRNTDEIARDPVPSRQYSESRAAQRVVRFLSKRAFIDPEKQGEVDHLRRFRMSRARVTTCYRIGAVILTTILLLPATAFAQSPWERAASNLALTFTGPLARSLALVAIVIGGLLFMFGEAGAKRQISGIVFGGGLALFAAQFLTWLF